MDDQTPPGIAAGDSQPTKGSLQPFAEEKKTQGLDEGTLQLQSTVEQLLAKEWGRRVKLVSLKREPSPYATLFPAEVLSLTLSNGERTSIFLKHLGSEESDHPEKQRRDREVRVYETLLRNEELPVAKYYGSRRNERTQRHEVFLEYVDDWNLEYQDLEIWFSAARRLAHLHAYFSERIDRLLACDFLLRFDAAYLYEWADRAIVVVADQSAELARQLEQVVKHYNEVADVITSQPLTLVHNDLAPKNVIADRSVTPARIVLVDWEMAGLGCGLLDLVHLKYGLDRENDQKMRDAYCAELAMTGLLPIGRKACRSLFAACELHKTVYRLAFSKVWHLPIDRVAQWVSETHQLLSKV